MKQGKRKGSKRIKKEDMLASVVEFFNQDRKRAFNYKQVAHGVGATTTPQKQMVFQLLEGMAEQNFLIEVSPGKYKANSRGTEVIGRFERRVNGKNHVITDDDESIFIAERNASVEGTMPKARWSRLSKRLPRYLSERWRYRNILHSC